MVTMSKQLDAAWRSITARWRRAHGAAQDSVTTESTSAGADWRVLLAALPDAAVVLDPASRVLDANRPFLELYPDVQIGAPLSRWLRNPDLFQAIEAGTESGQPEVVTLLHRLPVERRIAARAIRLDGRDMSNMPGGAPFMLITFRDLTEQDKLAQMREDFIANASHELRTPLASLRGFIETLQGPARDDAAAHERFLALMAGQAARMTRLIDDLLSLSRVEMRAHVMPRGRIDLNEVASHVVETLRPVADAAHAEITVALASGKAGVRGDHDELVQVLTNLMQNAFIYGGTGVNVRVEVTKLPAEHGRPERVRLSVSDNGPGIAKEHLPRLTERFYRPSVSASRSKGGTGLGLAIVKHIVARHRGELEIHSELGKGSTFAVVLDQI